VEVRLQRGGRRLTDRRYAALVTCGSGRNPVWDFATFEEAHSANTRTRNREHAFVRSVRKTPWPGESDPLARRFHRLSGGVSTSPGHGSSAPATRVDAGGGVG